MFRPAKGLQQGQDDTHSDTSGEVAPAPSAPVASRAPTLEAVSLDTTTVREVLGAKPDPHDVAIIRFEVLAAIEKYEAGIRTGALPPRLVVRGRPLADWLDLGHLARLLRGEVRP